MIYTANKIASIFRYSQLDSPAPLYLRVPVPIRPAALLYQRHSISPLMGEAEVASHLRKKL
jgi:hypothetical protein